MSAGRILIVDDEPDIRSTVKEILEDEGYTAVVLPATPTRRAACSGVSIRMRYCSISGCQASDGIALLREWAAVGVLDTCPVIMMSGHGTVETAVEATRLGAWDFIEKPIALAKLLTHARARARSQPAQARE